MVASDTRMRPPYSLLAPLQAGSEINGVAHHGVVHHQLRADAADEYVAGSDAYPQIERIGKIANAEKLRKLGSELRNQLDHFQGSQAGEPALAQHGP